MNQEQVLEACRKCGAMLEGHFQLTSGRHSDRYFQCALLLCDPRRAGEMARALAMRIEDRPEVVVGPAMGAVVWSYASAMSRSHMTDATVASLARHVSGWNR